MSSNVLENKFQAKVIKEVEEKFPGCIILKNDARYLQGIPDVVIHNSTIDVNAGYIFKTAFLEIKKDAKAPHRPNQDAYVEKINNMGGFARFVYPENKDHVLTELELYFSAPLDVPF